MSAAYDAEAARQRAIPWPAAGGALDLRALARLGTLAPSSHNTQPWLFRIGDEMIQVAPDLTRRCPVVDPDDAHLFKSLGCAAETIVQAAAAAGHATAMRIEPGGSITLSFRAAEGLDGTLAAAIPQRQCTRRCFDGRPIAPGQRKALAAAGTGEGVRVALVEDAAVRGAIGDLVAAGNRAQLGDPAFRAELFAWVRCTAGEAIATGDGLSSFAAGQPALPRWLVRLLLPVVLTASAQVARDSEHLATTPMLAAFVAVSDDIPAWIEIGRCYQRLALRATLAGIRHAHINQPIEVRDLRPHLHAALGLGPGEQALLLLRLGYGAAAPFSLRRPLDAMLRPV
ncbi:Acg family FMN-binding oxidoreductase [Elioraea sp.]|uniref:Acg family FMN-binding oxidoreductase n=1 Tax=Elioraea sp. TaxID=2185103 RepID=UPI003F6F94CF